ncbi:transporter [Novosphingobium rosa]|uniref:transporter n=1 Tax=Novosphingobium rosa TaxID=76978 RepID=UPI000834A493|nr:transporter [Novosphingobium rosa]
MRNIRLALALTGAAWPALMTGSAHAAETGPSLEPAPGDRPAATASRYASTEADIAELRAKLDEQRAILDAQAQEIHALEARLRAVNPPIAAAPAPTDMATSPEQVALLDQRAMGADPQTAAGQTVGQAPAPDESHSLNTKTASIPPGQGVLTPSGHFSIEPTFEYAASANNRLTFSGVELIPGLQLGAISASTAQRDTFFFSPTFRYGINSRFEVEVTVPLLYRHDNIQVVQQRDEQIVRTLDLRQKALGDVEVGLRYQLNPAKGPDKPIWILSLHVKSNTGIGPYDVGYDNFGIATGLATGSGFWGVEPGVSFLLPSDPVVIYGSLNYLHQFKRNLNKDVGGSLVQEVRPGEAILGNIGFGFSLNPRFSFSLGYSHSYIMPTMTYIGSGPQYSTGQQIGTLDLGMSYRLTSKTSMNLNFQFGVTPDAPNLNVTLRIPFSL